MNSYHEILMEKETYPVEEHTTYQYREDRPLRWLQRLLCWALRKLKAHKVTYRDRFQRIEINAAKLRHFLIKAQCEHERMYGERIRGAIVGWRTFEKFIHSEDIRSSLVHGVSCFDFPMWQWQQESKYHRADYLGFKIYVLPWYPDGVIVLPEGRL